jgi:hypothetical protein
MCPPRMAYAGVVVTITNFEHKDSGIRFDAFEGVDYNEKRATKNLKLTAPQEIRIMGLPP